MKQGNIIVKNAAQLVTCSGWAAKKGREMSDPGIIEDGTLVITRGIVSYAGPASAAPPADESHMVIDATGKAVLPGFIDPHTHFVFGGYREDEFSWRMRGDSYMSIMERGGGISRTMELTRRATNDELKEEAHRRLNAMLAMGVTTVEGKSGYGMDLHTEIKQLEVMQSLATEHVMDIVPTFLGAHVVPPDYKGREDEFLDFLIATVMPVVLERGLAGSCDIFCEEGVFSASQSRRFLTVAREMGFTIKLHADEIKDTGGGALGAALGALSADHLLCTSPEGIQALAASDTVATLLPCTAFCLREEYARGRDMIDAGCAVALATDLNPGSCFTSSIPLVIALACIYMRLTPEEAVTALTINAAAALGRAATTGSLDPGKQGDALILHYPSYRFLPYNAGMNIVSTVIKNGNIVVRQ